MKNGWSSRRPDMTYESCCGKISVVVYSSSTPASALITKSSGISSCFQVDVFVFYVYGSSSSSWDICVLPVSRPSRVRNLINTSTRSLWILWTFTCSILTWTHSETLLGGCKKSSRRYPEQLDSDFRSENGDSDVCQCPLFSHMNSV